jgi:hypothetical protein
MPGGQRADLHYIQLRRLELAWGPGWRESGKWLEGAASGGSAHQPDRIAKELAGFAYPRQTCELVYGGNHEGGPAAVDWLVYAHHRQPIVT